MKNLKYVLAILLMTIGFTSCEDDSVKAILNSEVSPNELLAPSQASYVLSLATKDETLETFKWTAPDYGFVASITYKLQIALAGSNFANPVELASTQKLEATLSVGSTNDILLGLGLVPETPTDVEIRVVSTINDKVDPVYSNIRNIQLSAYATSFPPIWGMGDGLKGWGPWPDNAVEWQSSEFKKYETVAYFTNGGAFRFFAQLDWNPTSYNYPFFTTVGSAFANANDGDSNFKIVGASGWYKVGVDLGTKTVTTEAVSEPLMYMTGEGTGGWDQPGTGASIKMKYLQPGVFEATATFINNGAFRFFAQADWGPTSYNYPFFSSVDANFVNANDGDSNLKYVGTTGVQKITVNINDKTVTLGEPPLPVLFMSGDATGGWDQPGTGNSVKMTYKSPGVFEATTNFTNNGAFRFFAQADWGPTSYNFPYFTNVDARFVNAADGDSNLKFTGASGSYTINVNLTTKVVTLTP